MNAKEFLRNKKILAEAEELYPLLGTFGKVDLVTLLDEYADQRDGAKSEAPKQPKPKAATKAKKK